MGLKSCEIYFDNQSNTYYAGQTVNGHVDFTFDAPKKVRGIKIIIKGVAHTHWTESKTVTSHGKSESKTVYYDGREEYFYIEYYLIGGQETDEIELPVGTKSHPFTCVLPPTLPSSFEGLYGYVRYTVKVILDRPWKFNQETKVAFTVVSPLDLNTLPQLKDPYKIEEAKTFCCYCCRSNPLTLVVHVPRTGFVAGQKIPITAEVDNASNVDVKFLKYELNENVIFYSRIPHISTKISSIPIANLSHGPINGGESRTSIHELEIPPLPPSNLTNCSIIDVFYEISIEAETSGCHINLCVTLPVTLGTTPFVSFSSQPALNIPAMISTQQNANQPLLSEGTSNMKPIGWNTPGQGFGDSAYPLYPSHHQILPPEIPPPTYAESQFGTKSIQDDSDNQYTHFPYNAQGYAPRYPVYEHNPTAPPSSP